MGTKQRFGGAWTVEKLDILSGYLDFYVTALKNQPFTKIYIDAFAGTGSIKVGCGEEIIEGSAKIALKAINKFDEYIFIEKDRKYACELESMTKEEFPDSYNRVKIYNDECNSRIYNLCKSINWSKSRAILFLDPFATELKWETLEIVAETKAIDVWYLFPLGAANRLMRNDGEIEPSWKARLDLIFGERNWYQEFYKEDPQISMFTDDEKYYKDINTDSLAHYICDRLHSIFPAVAQNPRMLYNTKKSPLFLFCFAVANDNPKAMKLALKGANYVLNYNGK